MDIYGGIAIAIVTIVTVVIMIINDNMPRVSDVLQLMNILPCYEIKVIKDGKRLNYNELIKYIDSPVKDYKLKEGILYIEIY